MAVGAVVAAGAGGWVGAGAGCIAGAAVGAQAATKIDNNINNAPTRYNVCLLDMFSSFSLL
jgi:hypothetical protein